MSSPAGISISFLWYTFSCTDDKSSQRVALIGTISFLYEDSAGSFDNLIISILPTDSTMT